MHGYNELAKKAEKLGEKVFCRLARDAAQRASEKLGVKIAIERDATILTLGSRMPYIEFTAKDIDMMRAAVADFDQVTRTGGLHGQ